MQEANGEAGTFRGTEKTEIGREDRAVMLDGEVEVKAVPQGHLVAHGKLKRLKKARANVKQARYAFRHQGVGVLGIRGRNLLTAATLGEKTGEFRQQDVWRNEVNLSRRVLLKNPEGSGATRLG